MPLNEEILYPYKRKIFVETGTQLGGGVKTALDVGFKKIYSVEINDNCFKKSSERFRDNEKVNLIKGDSKEELSKILSQIQEPSTIWLDGHTDLGTPIMDEIKALQQCKIKNHTLLIDDVRNLKGLYKNLDFNDILNKIREINPNYTLSFIDSTHFPNDILVAQEKPKPKISAMMLTHNRKNWLRGAIKGILNQTYKDFELIIIDNASTDGTKEMVEEFDDERITYIRNKKNLYPSAVNQMINLANGEYIAICDDDDISLPERFEKSVEFLEKNLDVAMIGGAVIYIDKEGNEINRKKYPKELTFWDIYRSDGMINSSTVMMRKSILEEVGGYDMKSNVAYDYDLYLRIAKEHRIRNLDFFLSKYRVHGNNLSLNNLELTAKYRQRALLKWAKISCLCFSYNRVFQLENYIRSFLKFVNFLKINEKGLLSFPSGGVQLTVRYQYSKEKYKKGYEELIKKYPRVNFIEGHDLIDFKEQVLEWLNNAPDFVMFGCDDVIFKGHVDIDKVMEKLKLDDTIGFSLRLGRGINHYYPNNSSMKEPKYEEDEILKWDWKHAEKDFGYPFELDATVYRKEFVESVINSLGNWGHPNLLEGLGANFVRQFGEKYGKYLYAFPEPKALVIQINRVQDLSPNPFFDTGYDVETLFNLWRQRKKLDLDYYKKKFNCIFTKDFILEGEKQEKVSVIIPVYNQKEKYFKECIQSVLDQTRKPDEIIIVDDGSDEPIMDDFASSTDIKIIRNEKNMGVGYTRQRGVDEATGDYIAFLSSDDVWDKDFLKIMSETARKHGGKILYSESFAINRESNVTRKTAQEFFEDHEDFCVACWNSAYKDSMFVNFSTTFIPKEVFEEVQFDENLRFGEDLDFLLRSIKHFEYYLISQQIVYYRNVDNLTSRIWDEIPKQNKEIREKCWKYWKED